MRDPEFSSLNQQIRSCKDCTLAETRINAVCGEGKNSSQVIMIAQAPGEREDECGRMFVGPSGRIFYHLLSKAKVETDEFYMTNLIKCFLPKCRRPSEQEIYHCSKHLEKEVNLIQPKLFVPLGFHATRYLLKRFGLPRPKSKEYHSLFAKVIEVDAYIIFPLRHPTALLFNTNRSDQMEKNYAMLRPIIDNLS